MGVAMLPWQQKHLKNAAYNGKQYILKQLFFNLTNLRSRCGQKFLTEWM